MLLMFAVCFQSCCESCVVFPSTANVRLQVRLLRLLDPPNACSVF